MTTNDILTAQAIEQLISAVTQNGNARLSEIEVERLLNAIARVQSGVPTGPSSYSNGNSGESRNR